MDRGRPAGREGLYGDLAPDGALSASAARGLAGAGRRDDEDRSFGAPHDLLGYASQERAGGALATVRRDDDEIEIARRVEDRLRWLSQDDLRGNVLRAEAIEELAELARGVGVVGERVRELGLDQTRKADRMERLELDVLAGARDHV